MADNVLKTPYALSLNEFAQRKINNAIQLLGKALPASVVAVNGAIVTVKFEVNSVYTLPVVTIPLFGPEYIRYPIQVGDLGVVFPVDFHIGQISGLGGGIADLSTPANLAALVFFPIGNKNWTAVDPTAVVIRGPGGVELEDEAVTCKLKLTANGITITLPAGKTLTVNGGNGVVIAQDLVVEGNISAVGTIESTTSGIGLTTHKHSGVQTGSGDTGGPVA